MNSYEGVPLKDGIVRTPGMHLSILTGKVTRAERALVATRWHGFLWMSITDVVDQYGHDVVPQGGDHELQFVGWVVGHIRRETTQRRCWNKLIPDPYHLHHLLNQSVSPLCPQVSMHGLWLWPALTAVWAAWSSQAPVWMVTPDANGFPADRPVAPPHLTGLIFISLRLVKANPVLPEPGQPSTVPA